MRVSGFSGMGIVEWWNSGMVECVVTFLVHVGNNCIRVVAVMGR